MLFERFKGFPVEHFLDAREQARPRILIKRRCAQIPPPCFKSRAEMLDRMRDAALSARQVKRQHRPDDGPAKPRPVGHRRIDIGR